MFHVEVRGPKWRKGPPKRAYSRRSGSDSAATHAAAPGQAISGRNLEFWIHRQATSRAPAWQELQAPASRLQGLQIQPQPSPLPAYLTHGMRVCAHFGRHAIRGMPRSDLRPWQG